MFTISFLVGLVLRGCCARFRTGVPRGGIWFYGDVSRGKPVFRVGVSRPCETPLRNLMGVAALTVDMPEGQVTLGEVDSLTNDEESTVPVCIIATQPTRSELAHVVSQCIAHASQLVDTGFDATDRAEFAAAVKSGDIDVSPLARMARDVAFAIEVDGRQHVDNALRVTRNEGVGRIVIDSFTSLGENIEEIRDRIEEAVDAGAELHVTETATTINSDSAGAVLGVLDGLNSVGVELQRSASIADVREWLDNRDSTDGGRAPLGFTYTDEGELVTSEEFDDVRAVLSLVDSGEMSKRAAADRLDCVPRTVGRALDKASRYGLDDEG